MRNISRRVARSSFTSSFIVVALLLFTLALPRGARAAEATPQLSLHVTSLPTHITPVANDEQELAVTATGGDFTITYNERAGVTGSSRHSNPIPFNAPASGPGSVQQALEALVGAGNVEVIGPAGGPYTIIFIGALAEQEVPLMSVDSTALEGPGATASLATTTVGSGGRASITLLLTNVGAAPTSGLITVVDHLPEGLRFVAVQNGLAFYEATKKHREETLEECRESEPSTVTCEIELPLEGHGRGGADIPIAVQAEPSLWATEDPTDTAEVSGGGAPTVSTSLPIQVAPQGVPFGLSSADFQALDAAGNPETRAGSHPELFSLGFDLNSQTPAIHATGSYASPQDLKDLVIDFPVGYFGNPQAAEPCPEQNTLVSAINNCPNASRLGAFVFAGDDFNQYISSAWSGSGLSPFMSTVPEFGFPAQFASVILGVAAGSHAELVHTSAGYAIQVTTAGIPSVAQARSAWLYLYGDPDEVNEVVGPQPPFYTMPSDCQAAGLHAEFHVDSWQDPAPLPLKPDGSTDFEKANFSDPQWANHSVEFPTPVGCNRVHFEPKLQARPTTNRADSPSGLDVALQVPQDENSKELATPPVKDWVTILPKGLTLNPSGADGLQACTESQIDLDAVKPGNCPLASKLAEVELTSPLISHVIPGSMYLAAPECAPCGNKDAEEGKLLKLYLELNDPQTGTVIKVPGTNFVDPKTGQLKADFPNQPQLPYSEIKIDFKQGPRAPLTTPSTCGTYETASSLTPWSAPESGPPADPADHWSIESGPNAQGCHGSEAEEPGSLHFEAGTTSTQAGAYAPFVLKLTREDGSQRLQSSEFTLPRGITARLAGVQECSDAAIKAAESTSGAQQALSPSCPLASEVGSVDVATGSGPTPFHVGGHAYLAGPYEGAPLSIAVITPAKAGPFDLGTVVVHSPLYLNPETAQATVKTGSLPTILAGIPLDIRAISVSVSRSQFTLNPTNCEKMAVTGEALTTLGQSSSLASPFQVGGCRALPFKPKLSLSLRGKTNRGASPAFTAVLQMKAGEANIARAQVALPSSEFVDNAHFNTICTRVQFAAGAGHGEQCPPGSVYGHATAYSPLLEKPLVGPVFLRSSTHELPDLVAALRGQIDVDLDGRVDSFHQGLRNTFEVVPDAPVSKFVLRMQGGKKGLFENSTNICEGTHLAIAKFTGQNGKVDEFNPPLRAKCPKAHKKHRAHHKRHRRSRAG